MKTKLINIFIHPATLSLVFSIIIIYLLPVRFDPYVIEQVDKKRLNTGVWSYYVDLDGDGVSERIEMNENYNDNLAVLVYKDEAIVNQWNMYGKKVHVGAPFWGDVDNDGSLELFFATWHHDSIYIHCLNPLQGRYYLQDQAIFPYKPDGINDWSIHIAGVYNTTPGGLNTLVFSTVAGLSARPRRMFALDFDNETLYISPPGCINWLNPFGVQSGDPGQFVFTGNTQAVANCDTTDAYSDIHSWFVLLDKRMHFKFSPVKVGNYPSKLDVATMPVNHKNNYILLNDYKGTGRYHSSLLLFSQQGEKILERTLSYDKHVKEISIKRIGRHVYLIMNNGRVEEIDVNLNRREVAQLPPLGSVRPIEFDLDRDGRVELVFFDAEKQNLIITRNNFSDPAIFDLGMFENLHNASLKQDAYHRANLVLNIDSHAYVLHYGYNPFYLFQYLLALLIFGVIYAAFFQMNKQQKARAEKKYIKEKEIAELQLRSIKNQLDPHFTLNIINTIGNLFYKQDKEKADYLFGKYSKLLRTTILGSDSICNSLEAEIAYVRNYLELEKYRLGERLFYEIVIDDNVDLQYNIPKMLIHTFVENALKHGVRRLKKQGCIMIEIKKESDVCLAIIRDNGIGRQAAAQYAGESTGKGLEILDKILDLYYDTQKVRITYRIRDLINDSGEALGTEVIITIPVYLN